MGLKHFRLCVAAAIAMVADLGKELKLEPWELEKLRKHCGMRKKRTGGQGLFARPRRMPKRGQSLAVFKSMLTEKQIQGREGRAKRHIANLETLISEVQL